MLVVTVTRQPTIACAHVLLTGLRSTMRPKLGVDLSPEPEFWFCLLIIRVTWHGYRQRAADGAQRHYLLLTFNNLASYTHAHIPEKVSYNDTTRRTTPLRTRILHPCTALARPTRRPERERVVALFAHANFRTRQAARKR